MKSKSAPKKPLSINLFRSSINHQPSTLFPPQCQQPSNYRGLLRNSLSVAVSYLPRTRVTVPCRVVRSWTEKP